MIDVVKNQLGISNSNCWFSFDGVNFLMNMCEILMRESSLVLIHSLLYKRLHIADRDFSLNIILLN